MEFIVNNSLKLKQYTIEELKKLILLTEKIGDKEAFLCYKSILSQVDLMNNNIRYVSLDNITKILIACNKQLKYLKESNKIYLERSITLINDILNELKSIPLPSNILIEIINYLIINNLRNSELIIEELKNNYNNHINNEETVIIIKKSLNSNRLYLL